MILGVSGQDGSYLAQQLLEHGYRVVGVVRRTSSLIRERLDQSASARELRQDRFTLEYGDVLDAARLGQIIREHRPSEIYNLAAQSHIQVSLVEPVQSFATNAMGAMNVLEAARMYAGEARVFQAGSSEMFAPQASRIYEGSPLAPSSPYGVSRAATFHMTRMYREVYGLFCVTGIMFNHESPRRSENFVTRKISIAAAQAFLTGQAKLRLGSTTAARDWGFAPEYTAAMHDMLRRDCTEDLILATGKATTVQEFVDLCFDVVGLESSSFLELDSTRMRPNEAAIRVGDASLARSAIGWAPRIGVERLAQIMVEADIDRMRNGKSRQSLRDMGIAPAP